MSSVERQGPIPSWRSRTFSTDTKPSWLSPFHKSFPAFNTHLMQRRSWNAAKPEVAYAATVLLANEKLSLQTHSLPRQCPETVCRHAGRSWPRGALHDVKGHHCLWGCYFGVLLAHRTHLEAEGLWMALEGIRATTATGANLSTVSVHPFVSYFIAKSACTYVCSQLRLNLHHLPQMWIQTCLGDMV